MALTITITDRTTIGLIKLYHQYVHEEHQIHDTAGDLAQGLVTTFLEEHDRFREWRKALPMETQPF